MHRLFLWEGAVAVRSEAPLKWIYDDQGRRIGSITTKSGRYCLWELRHGKSLVGIFGSLEEAERFAAAMLSPQARNG
jgi:hypothetical protein